MKKIVGYASSAALALSFNLAVPSAAHADTPIGQAIASYCQAGAPGFPIPVSGVGDCVSLIHLIVNQNNGANTGPVFFCNLISNFGFYTGPLGQCVSDIRNQ